MPDELTLLDLIDDGSGELGRRLWPLIAEEIRLFRCGSWTADPDVQACACPTTATARPRRPDACH